MEVTSTEKLKSEETKIIEEVIDSADDDLEILNTVNYKVVKNKKTNYIYLDPLEENQPH